MTLTFHCEPRAAASPRPRTCCCVFAERQTARTTQPGRSKIDECRLALQATLTAMGRLTPSDQLVGLFPEPLDCTADDDDDADDEASPRAEVRRTTVIDTVEICCCCYCYCCYCCYCCFCYCCFCCNYYCYCCNYYYYYCCYCCCCYCCRVHSVCVQCSAGFHCRPRCPQLLCIVNSHYHTQWVVKVLPSTSNEWKMYEYLDAAKDPAMGIVPHDLVSEFYPGLAAVVMPYLLPLQRLAKEPVSQRALADVFAQLIEVPRTAACGVTSLVLTWRCRLCEPADSEGVTAARCEPLRHQAGERGAVAG